MKKCKLQCLVVIVLLMFVSQMSSAQPTFQVWSPDYFYAGDYYIDPEGDDPDEDTWFVRFDGTDSFELWAIGAYHPETTMEQVSLLVSVPDGETGTVTIVPLGDTAPILSVDTYTDTSFLPDNFNSHYPLQDTVSDFIVFGIDPFEDLGETIYDYNADSDDPDGEIILTGSTGQINEYLVTVAGYSWAHFDLFGLTDKGWEISPGSHDLTWVPAPGAVLLGGIGVCIIGWLRRRKTL